MFTLRWRRPAAKIPSIVFPSAADDDEKQIGANHPSALKFTCSEVEKLERKNNRSSSENGLFFASMNVITRWQDESAEPTNV